MAASGPADIRAATTRGLRVIHMHRARQGIHMRHAHIFRSRDNAPHVPRSIHTFPRRTIMRRRGVLHGHNGTSSEP